MILPKVESHGLVHQLLIHIVFSDDTTKHWTNNTRQCVHVHACRWGKCPVCTEGACVAMHRTASRLDLLRVPIRKDPFGAVPHYYTRAVSSIHLLGACNEIAYKEGQETHFVRLQHPHGLVPGFFRLRPVQCCGG